MLYPNKLAPNGLQKQASAYPPGYRSPVQQVAKQAAPQQVPNNGKIQQPGGGFGISQTAAADFPTNDPYSTYNQAATSDQIWSALQTEAGRIAVGAQMA
jgi:hypothetical protein